MQSVKKQFRVKFPAQTFLLPYLLVLSGATSLLAIDSSGTLAGGTIGWYQCSAPVQLDNTADYSWWYGCSPTAAGMMMGYYDRNGYLGQDYGNLVPGGVAEANTFGNPGALVNSTIASSGHITDFYPGGYRAQGDDNPQPWHSFNCLADFMGTSQDALGNPNGTTTFYYWTDGQPFTAQDAFNMGVWNQDGMYGIGEYLNYAGYGYTTLYTQLIDTAASLGFTYNQYMAEIDAGRPVMIELDGHTMLGYGYDAAGNLVYVYDTWTQGPHTMTWGGTYGGMSQWGVEVLEIASVPEPNTFLLLVAAGLIGRVYICRRVK